MATTFAIPLITLPAGQTWFPQPQGSGEAVPDGTTQFVITIDRTVAGGLNSLASSDTFTVTAFQSDDGGVTWLQRSQDGVPCGPVIDKLTGLTETVAGLGVTLNPGTGRQAALQVTASASVKVQGSLALS